jgi:hypothetical protein
MNRPPLEKVTAPKDSVPGPQPYQPSDELKQFSLFWCKGPS